MSPKYWVSSEDLSADSSLEGSEERSRDHSVYEEEDRNDEDAGAELSTAEESVRQSFDDGTVARTAGANVTLPRLPNLQPQQHATLFYLSLIEGRCRTQAANTFNAGRSPEDIVSEEHPEVLALAQHLFAEMRNELVKAGLLPEDFAASTLPDLRQYLDSFDSLLGTISTQRAFNISAQQDNRRALPHFERSSFHSGIVPYNAGQLLLPLSAQQNLCQTGSRFGSSFFTSDLVPYNPGPLALMAPHEQQLQRSPPSKLSLFFPNVQDTSVGESFYARDYKQIGLLGRGGFGKVYKAHYRLDGAEYAVKKIVLKASHLRYLLKEKKLDRIPREIKTLARLDHHHVTRYHHCWIESRPCSLPGDDDDASDYNSDASTSGVLSQSMAALTSGIESIQFGLEHDLEQQLKRERRATFTSEEPFDSSVQFSNSGSNKHSNNSNKVKNEDRSPKSMFRKPGEDSSSDEVTDDVEEIPRVEIAETLDADDIVLKEDFILFIKMTPYPLTLHALISIEDKKVHEHSKIKHCFHPLPTVRLLLAILEGVEYLHRKKIIHRDLKPQNIFLAILDPEEKPTQGYINIDNCPKCGNKKKTNPTFVCPKLGDFGLIYELKSTHATHSLSSGLNSSPFVSSNVGTAYYSPPVASEPCAKVDVFSLGVIAFELLYQFKTETERRVVLGKLGKSGETPDDFASHPMKEGIEKMVCRDVNWRWSTTLVREWLEGLIEQWV
ncbi:kinase-like protein [Stipitochalara longipes BDJ]|nr:kinase-like protein [Stipitochalara longipes BDJ]